MISCDILSKTFLLKCKGLLYAKVVSISKKDYSFAVHFWTLNINWSASYEITLVHLSVCLSLCLYICPSVCLPVWPSLCLPLNILKRSLVFPDIEHGDS